MNGWRDCKLGDVLTLKRGYDLPQRERSPGTIPIVSSSGITDHHAEAKVRGPGVVTGRYGTLGEVFYVASDYWPLNTALYVSDFKGTDPRFAAYFLQQLNLGQRNAAGAVPGVNRNHLHAMDVRVPPIDEQRHIAGVLSAYDDLIENCERRIRVLDNMARSLYREWFVDLRYLGAAAPKADGWSTTTVGEAAAYLNRGVAPSYADDGPSVVLNQKCIRDGKVSFGPARRQTKTIPPDKCLRAGDVLVNSTGVGTLGRVAQLLVTPGACTVDTHVTIVRPADGVDPTYFGLALLHLEPEFERKGQGATGQTELSRGAIAETALHLPPHDAQARFGRLMSPVRDEQAGILARVENLRKTRDLLLPRLLSGQLSLKKAEAAA